MTTQRTCGNCRMWNCRPDTVEAGDCSYVVYTMHVPISWRITKRSVMLRDTDATNCPTWCPNGLARQHIGGAKWDARPDTHWCPTCKQQVPYMVNGAGMWLCARCRQDITP